MIPHIITDIEQKVVKSLAVYLLGIVAAFVLEVGVLKLRLPALTSWILFVFISLYAFTWSKMSGPIAATTLAWTMTGILMALHITKGWLPVWAVYISGSVLLFILEPLFKRADLASDDMPPTYTKPIPQEEYFNYARKGVSEGRIFMGINVQKNRPVWISQKEMTEHVHVVGITGCGKSQYLLSLAYQAMIRKWGCIFISGKPSFADWKCFLWLANHASRGADAFYFNPLDPESDTFNPIAPVSRKATEIEVAHQIMRAIGREPPSSQERLDAFHRVIDFERILHLSSILVELGSAFTLEDCYYYYADQNAREYVLQKAEKTPLKNMLGQVRKQMDGEILKISNPAGLTSSLRPWIAKPLTDKVNCYAPNISMPDLFMNGGLAYFSLSPGRMQQQANSMGRQIIAQVLSCSEMLREKVSHRPPTLLILDEFQEYLTPSFSTLISQARSGELCLVLAHQDFGQLQRVEGTDKRAFAENVINNAATKVFFSTLSPDSATVMSEIFGTKKVIQKSQSFSFEWMGDVSHTGMSQREGEEFVVHPNWFKTNKTFMAGIKTKRGMSVIRTALFIPKGNPGPRATSVRKPDAKSEKAPLNLAHLVRSDLGQKLQNEREETGRIERQEIKRKAKDIYDKLSGDSDLPR